MANKDNNIWDELKEFDLNMIDILGEFEQLYKNFVSKYRGKRITTEEEYLAYKKDKQKFFSKMLKR